MNKTTVRKTARYAKLASFSDPWAAIDAGWAETRDPRFDQARKIDDWLMATRENEAVSEEDFYQRCVEFYRLYAQQ